MLTKKVPHRNHVIIVSSGAVALGKKIFHSDSEKLDLEQSQAAAAVGQIKLYCENC